MHVVKIKVKATGKTVEVGAETAASMVQGGFATKVSEKIVADPQEKAPAKGKS